MDNHLATAERGFGVIGLKERNRNRALEIEPGDLIVLYLTKVMRFAGVIRVTGELHEDRERVWPGKPGNPDPYPWRFETESVVVVEESDWVPAEDLRTQLEHVMKWPADHWKLAFQGQIRAVTDADRDVLVDRLRASAGAAA